MKLISKLAGYYKLEIEKPNGERKIVADWFPNLITNTGLDRIGVSTTYLNYCQVGAGSTAPAVTDNSLVSYLAETNVPSSTTGNSGSSPYYSWDTKVYTFTAGVATGNVSEVGISYTSIGPLFSRALILDGVGSPISITVAADEVLYVTYQLRRYVPEVDTGGVVTIDTVDYTFVGRAANADSKSYWPCVFSYHMNTFNLSTYNGSIGAITSTPSGASGTSTGTLNITAYTPGSYATEWEWEFSLAQGNAVGGISAVLCSCAGGVYQFSFSPVIPKTSDKIMTLTFTTGWGRL